MNTIGKYYRLTTYGESHGVAMGGIIDGLPSGVHLDMDAIMKMLDRRRTGKSLLTSQRRETDIPEILSGVNAEGYTLGTPIGFIFRNSDHRSEDYSEIADLYRPNHADRSYELRFGIRDPRGGGRASARETVNWVMGGAVAMEWLKDINIEIEAKVTGVGESGYKDILKELSNQGDSPVLPYNENVEQKMLDEVAMAKANLDSVGGTVTCVIRNIPAGIGTPVFGKLQAALASAMMSLNAVKGFEYGLGAESAKSHGSDILDLFNPGFSPAPTVTNFSGGIQGGISTGMPVFFNVYFKPTPTIPRQLPFADRNGDIRELTVNGRHDPCVALRAPVIVEALTAMVIADKYIERYGYQM